MRVGCVLSCALLIAAPDDARAGRTFYGWMHGTEVMPERGAELQSWLGEENRIEEESNRSESVWGFGAFIGITDQLELGLPLNIVWWKVPGSPGSTALNDYGVEARYRLVTQDPEEAPAFAPLVRVAVNRLVLERDAVRPEVNLLGSYEVGSVHVLAELGWLGDISRDDHHFELRPGLGVSVNATGDLRLGVEAFAQISLDDRGSSWAVIGPNLAWTHGRFWLSATYGVGVHQIKNAPRMQWGIAF